MRKTAAKLLAAAAIATSVATVASGVAVADPSTLPTLPAAQDIVGVGSDTTQEVLNGLSLGYNAALTAAGDTTSPRLYSWDATGTSPITTKTGATSIARPNGSGAGIGRLENLTSATVDFARSSRGPANGTDQVTDVFVAYAKDAVSWAAKAGGNAPADLTTAQLKDIYTCNKTTWNALNPAWPATTIKPYLPQSASGTRAFFLKALGGAVPLVPGTCVVDGLQENTGTEAALNDNNALVPYSVAHYIGQVYYGHTSPSDNAGPVTIRNINGINPVTTSPSAVITGSFSTSAFGRNVYNVVRSAEWTATDAHGVALQKIFGSNGYICSTAGATILKNYGFLPILTCGITSQPQPPAGS
ncbi:PstS family phosphate ABC transporter substrate-binding protein [Kitasatospora sp. NPDC057965]|uniref:PstS family phosphate ABC transporter substrate-binding protein n=1 Tax=Kitasatospora sp. NPDC057965 TaxID=3346291 RepID=UPI0036DA7163